MKKVLLFFTTSLLFCVNFLFAQCTLVYSSPPGLDNQTKCTGVAISPIDYTVGGGATGATVTGQPSGISGTMIGGGLFRLTGSSTQIGTFNYTVTTTGSCGTPATATGTITIIPNHTIALTSGAGSNFQTVCINTPINDITYTVGGSANDATVAGLPSGIVGSFSGGVLTISGMPTSQIGTFNYTVTTLGPCVQAVATGTITVNPNATITLTSGAGSNNQTKCINNFIQNITYNVSVGVTGATVTGLPAGVNGSFSAGVFTIFGTPTQAGVFNYTVFTVGPCVQTTATGTLTINGNSIISLATGSGTKSQTICIGTALVPIIFVVSGSGTGATVTGLPAGVSGSFSNGNFTISGTPTIAGTFNYTVTTMGPCLQASETGTIKVNPNITIALTSGVGSNIQTRCVDNAITNITYAIGTGGTGATVTGLPAGVTGAFAAGVFTISGTPTQSGTFAYIVQPTGPCNLATGTGTITVNANSVITLTSGTNSNNQTKCLNTALTNITYSITGGGTGATVAGLPTGVTGAFLAGVFTISGTPTQAGTFNYTVTTIGPCLQATATGTLIINANSTVVLSSAPNTNNQTICINTPLVNIVYTVEGAGTGATVAGLPAGVAGTFSSGIFTISGSPSVTGTFNYTVTPVGPCILANATGIIVVNPNASMVLTSGANSSNQTKCINTPILNISYAISGGGTGATVVGLPLGTAGTFAAGVFTISGTPTESGLFTYTVTTTGNCAQTTATGTLLINANSTIALNSAPNSNIQTICQSNPLTNIVYAVGGGGTGATVAGLPAGITGSFAAGIFTISGAPTVTGTFNYTVTTTGPCGQVTATGTIVVNPNATIVLSSGSGTNNQNICFNVALTNIVYTIGGGGTGTTVSGLPSGVTGSTVGNVFTITGTPTQLGVFNYTVTTNGSCSAVTSTGTITINTNASITLTSGSGSNSQTICINKAINNITYAVGGGGSGATVTGLPAGLTGSFAAGVFTISGSPANVGIFNYTVQTTGTCTQTNTTGTVTVTPNQSIVLATGSGASSQQICINTSLVNINFTVGGAGTGATAAGLPSGVTGTFANGNFSISGQPSVAGVFSYIVTTSGNCDPATTTGTITVNPDATLLLSSGSGSNNQSVCINAKMTDIMFTASGATTVTASGLPTGVVGNFASNLFTITGTPILAGTYNYNLVTSGLCKSATASGTITVLPNATIGLTSGVGSTNQTLCANVAIQNITYAIGGSGTGAVATNLPAGVTGSFLNGIYTISGTPTQAGTFNLSVTTTGNCGQANASGILNVKAIPVLSLGSNSPLVLNDTLKLFGNHNLTGSTFQWSGPLGFSSTAQNPIRLLATLDMSGVYTVTVTNSGCSAVGTVNVLVNPKLKATIVNAGKDTICSGDTLRLTANPVDPKFKYVWSSGDTTSNIAKTPTTNIAYIVTITDVASGFLSLDTIDITVNATPEIVQLNNFSRCSGLPFDLPDFTISPVVPGTPIFSWTNSNNAIGLGAAGVGQIPVFTPVFNNSGANIDGLLSYSAEVKGCRSVAKTFTVTVFPRPNATLSIEEKSGDIDNDRVVCENTTITLSASSNLTPGPFEFEWNNPAIKGAKITDSPTGPITGVGSKIYVVTVTDANGCNNTATDSVVINKIPVITSITVQESSGVKSNDSVICSRDTITLTANASNGSDNNYAFEWNINNAKTKSVVINPEVATGQGKNNYQVTVSNKGCRSSGNIDVSVFGLPTAEFSSQGKLNANSNIIWKDESKPNIGSPIKNWLWNFQNSSIPTVSQSSPSNITNSFVISGNNLVSLKVTDVNNCMDVKNKIIKIEDSGCKIKLDNLKSNYCLELKGTEISTLVNFNVSVQTTEVSPNMVGKFDPLPAGLVWVTNPAATNIAGNDSSTYSRSIKALVPGTYTIRLGISDDTTSSLLRCNASIFTATFTVNDIPRVLLKFSPESICNGDAATVALDFTTGKNPFLFKFNNAVVDSTAPNLVKNILIKKSDYAAATNNFHVVCIASIRDGNGCENNSTGMCDSLKIKLLPSITSLSDLNICQNQERKITVFHNKPDNNLTGYSYVWSTTVAGVKFDSINKVSTNIFVDKGLTGKLPIDIKVIDNVSGCRSERIDSIIVSNIAAPETDTIYKFLSTNTSGKNTFLYIYPKENFCFKWRVEDGQGGFKDATCLNGKNDVHYCELDTPEKISLRLWNCNAPECSSLVTVVRDLGGANDNDEISVYPNPTDGNLTIGFEGNEAEVNDFSIIDVLGKVVFSKTIVRQAKSEQINLDLEQLTSGAYYLLVADDRGVKRHFKFVVQK